MTVPFCSHGVTTWSCTTFHSSRLRDRSSIVFRKLRPVTTDEYPTAARRPRNSRLQSDLFAQAFGVRAIDSLYGHQWGLEGVLWRPTETVALEGVAKAGIYGNVSKQDSYLSGPGCCPSIATTTARVGFVGEAGLVGTWRIRPWLAARAGYQAFWLGGVATATNQLQGQSLAAGSPQRGSTNTGGSVVLQGIDLGLEGRF